MNLPFLSRRFATVVPSSPWLSQFEPQYEQVKAQVLDLSESLMARRSITPEDGGCQVLLRQRLAQMGFECEDLSRNGVTNTWATRGKEGPMLVMAGHTDVVPPGPRAAWHTEPFVPTVIDGVLYGRGAADMKTGLAALVVATERFIQRFPEHHGRLAFAMTSDEEGDAFDGTWAIIDKLKQQQLVPQWCLVGEPSSKEVVGDSVRVGRRGSLTGWVKIKGKQGHVAYADKVVNPIHGAQKLVKKLANKQWDLPSRYFPATSCQVVKFDSFSGANNLTPASAELTFNFRYSPKQTAKKLQLYVENKLKSYQLDYEVRWQVDALPFLCRNNKLLQVTRETIREHNGVNPVLNTAGGTSDGRFFAQLGSAVVELGVVNQTIHQPNEQVKLDELVKLVILYERILQGLFVR